MRLASILYYNRHTFINQGDLSPAWCQKDSKTLELYFIVGTNPSFVLTLQRQFRLPSLKSMRETLLSGSLAFFNIILRKSVETVRRPVHNQHQLQLKHCASTRCSIARKVLNNFSTLLMFTLNYFFQYNIGLFNSKGFSSLSSLFEKSIWIFF